MASSKKRKWRALLKRTTNRFRQDSFNYWLCPDPQAEMWEWPNTWAVSSLTDLLRHVQRMIVKVRGDIEHRHDTKRDGTFREWDRPDDEEISREALKGLLSEECDVKELIAALGPQFPLKKLRRHLSPKRA
jgi:hypothetical protein